MTVWGAFLLTGGLAWLAAIVLAAYAGTARGSWSDLAHVRGAGWVAFAVGCASMLAGIWSAVIV